MTRNAETLMPTRDGRRLAVRSSGPVDGIPLLFHHGTPGAGRPFRAFERAAHARGCELITYSRAGYGESTRRPGRSVADVASDMEDVLDHLGVTRCLVVGMSGGGPHALATAARLPGRVAGVLVIAGLMPDGLAGRELTDGMGEGNVVEFGLARQGEAALRAELEREAVALRDATAEELGEGMASVLSPADRAALDRELAEDLAGQCAEGLRPGVDGWLDDDLAFVRPWGFSVEEITAPVFVRQGEQDLMVPPAHGEWLARNIPHAVLHLEPDQGHLSFIARPDAMIEELVSVF